MKEKAGRIDVLVANAGFYEFGTLGEITEEHFDKTFGTNVRGLLFTVQKATAGSHGSSARPLSFHWLMPARETKNGVAESGPVHSLASSHRIGSRGILASSTSPSRLKPSRQVDGKR